MPECLQPTEAQKRLYEQLIEQLESCLNRLATDFTCAGLSDVEDSLNH